MKKALLILALLSNFACEKDKTGTEPDKIDIDITVNQNQNGQNSGSNGTTNPSNPAPNCIAKTTGASCTLNASLVTRLRVGENCRLNTTPKDAAGNALNESCASNGSLPTPSWGIAGPCNLTGNANSYNPQLNAISKGTCGATVVFGPNLTATVTIDVVD